MQQNLVANDGVFAIFPLRRNLKIITFLPRGGVIAARLFTPEHFSL